MDQLMDSDDVASFTKIPKRTLDQWAYRGIGPDFIKVGRHRRYRPEVVEAWLDAQTRATA